MSIYSEILGDLLLRGETTANAPFPAAFTADSRQVRPGVAFAAIPGTAVDGHDFIPGALAAGASLIVMERPLPLPPGTPFLLVRKSAPAFARLFRHTLGDPDEALTLLGVTGTNGKTTTAFLLEHIFGFCGRPCGLISTVTYRTGRREIPGSRTTPDTATLFSLFAEMRDAGMKCAAMELSSHSLVQDRAAGIQLRAGIFTNLTGDHLDYHGDMEHYFQAKKRLFTNFMKPEGVAVINGGDPWGARLARELEGKLDTVVFGTSESAPYRIKVLELAAQGVRFRLETPEYGELEIASRLAGLYNVFNLTGAVLAGLRCGLPPEKIAAALKTPFRVPGRLEAWPLPSGGTAFVDYAHTDDALTNVLTALKGITRGRIITVFGAGGDRDRSKRPRMGRAAAEKSDLLFVTSDNPRGEEPGAIIAEILTGIPAGTPFEVVPDRAEAIRRALGSAGPGDAVLIAGKGHEDYQEIKGRKHHFSDAEEVQRFIEGNTRK